jgi:hypothetical protein
MHWGLLALVFVISVAVGAGNASRKKHRAPKPPEEMN